MTEIISKFQSSRLRSHCKCNDKAYDSKVKVQIWKTPST